MMQVEPELPSNRSRALPAVHTLLAAPEILRAAKGVPRPFLKNLITTYLQSLRHNHRPIPGTEEIKKAIQRELLSLKSFYYQKIINLTGVMLHTNLGRAPLGAKLFGHLQKTLSGYSNLEFNIQTGRRGSRDLHLRRLLTLMSGAEEALLVNNAAAALVLTLGSLAHGREVLISRGEMIEIGDGFRIPEIIEASGAQLHEIGTTNRTHLKDYQEACTNNTAAILRAHPSNFFIRGFTEKPSLGALAKLAKAHGLPFIYDLGSATLPAEASYHENSVIKALTAGVDCLIFSGDKLFGGVQTGIILGKKHYLEKLRQNPLFRALRLDKLALASLDWLLHQYFCGRQSETLPLTGMLHKTPEESSHLACELASQLNSKLSPHQLRVRVIAGKSSVGGGSSPGEALQTNLVCISGDKETCRLLEKRFRSGSPSIIVRLEDGKILMDPSTLTERHELQAVIARAESL